MNDTPNPIPLPAPEPERFIRKNLPDSIRFEVFKRDKFTCQYCGRKSPDVILNADHIKPVAAGGTNDLMNLVTSCRDCNSGKSDTALDDSTAVEKSRAQAEAIQERREQVQMMAQWQIELAQMNPEVDAVEQTIDMATRATGGMALTDSGRKTVRNLLRKFSLQEVMEAVAIAFDSYDRDSAFGRIEGICKNRKAERENPELSRIKRIVYSVAKYRNNDSPANIREAIGILERFRLQGGDWQALSRDAEASAGRNSFYPYLTFLQEATRP